MVYEIKFSRGTPNFDRRCYSYILSISLATLLTVIFTPVIQYRVKKLSNMFDASH